MVNEVTAKSILRGQKYIDSWFLSSYGINLYRGCTHNCVYCDGRDEKYQVGGDYGRDISVKINAPELLARELDPFRKRKPFRNGFIFVGGGVCDSYQPAEKQYALTGKALELLLRFGHPAHMLTKSTLMERDLELLRKIREQSAAVVSFSFSCVDDSLGRMLEPGVPPPSARLDTIKRFKAAGFSCGMYLMPVVPFLTDSSEMLESSVAAAKDAGVDFIVFGGMTLKPGRQKDYFLKFIADSFPKLLPRYQQLYADNNSWGSPPGNYAMATGRLFDEAASKYRMPKRMPPEIWSRLVNRTEQIIIMLDQLGWLADLKGRNNPYTRAARTLSGAGQPLETLSVEQLTGFSGVGEFTAKIIREIAETGGCKYYNKLLVR